MLRKVQYPAKLDVMEMCDPKLTKSMSNARKMLINDKDKELGLTVKDVNKVEGDMDTAEDADDVDTDSSGNYELFGIVTHKGRSTDSGHYVGWVKAPHLAKEEVKAVEGAKKAKAPIPGEGAPFNLSLQPFVNLFCPSLYLLSRLLCFVCL
jgi:hypothetical protein